jgi:predicted dehydrogenase/threonine dehydrogenase-like Zn-dependent dehydrogenase
MKQVLQSRSARAAAVRDVPPPECAPGSVLVRTAFSAISSGTERTRVELSSKSLLGKARERPDLVRQVIERARKEGWRQTRKAVQSRLDEETPVGYSSAGEVIEVGEHVRGLQVGDLVACAGGGHANHAEIVSVPVNLVAKLPAGVSLQDASLATIAAIAMHGVRLAEVSLGERVAVVGCGLVGQIAIRLLRAAGASTFALDVDPVRVEDARRGGATAAFSADEHGIQRALAAMGGAAADAVIVTAASSSNTPLLTGAKLARGKGTLILVGAVPIEFPRALLYDKELTFRVSRSYGPGRYDDEYEERGLDYPIDYVRWTEQRNIEAVLDLIAGGQLDLSDLIESVYPVQDAGQAYRRLVGQNGDGPLRGALLLSYPGATGDGPPQPGSIPAIVPGSANGAKPSLGPVRLGLIGPGGFARRMILPAFVAAGAVPELVGGGAGPSAAAAQRNAGFQRVADSAGAVIDDDAVDAVAVCTRHASHAELSTRALRAGKHVFCEKPLALTDEELRQVIAAAEESHGILAVGFNRRFAPLVRRLREFVAELPGPVTCTYRVSAGRLAPDHWTHDLSQGGGRLLGEGCHFVDTIVAIAGSPVTEVYARGFSRHGLPVQAADNAVITLTLQDGSVGTIAYLADGSAKVGKERIEVFTGSRTGIMDDYRSLELYDGADVEQQRVGTQDKGHYAEVAAFVEGVRAGRPPVPLAEVANVSLATLAIVESMRTGVPVRLTTD